MYNTPFTVENPVCIAVFASISLAFNHLGCGARYLLAQAAHREPDFRSLVAEVALAVENPNTVIHTGFSQ